MEGKILTFRGIVFFAAAVDRDHFTIRLTAINVVINIVSAVVLHSAWRVRSKVFVARKLGGA